MTDNKIKIEIVRQTVADKKSVKVGAVLTLPRSEAMYLVHTGKAKIAAETAESDQKEASRPGRRQRRLATDEQKKE